MGKIINIFGSSGSGSTTLAKEIASKYDYYHIDVDDMLWEKTDPPFTIRRSDLEARKCIVNELKNKERVVISGSLVGFGDDIKEKINLFVFINLDIETRIKRIEKRERERFGERVMPGGDLYQKHLDFLEWVSNYETNPEYIRSRKQHLLWLEGVKCPVLKVTEELSINELMALVKPFV
ncbi:MAG TPA: AAA family ATPase [Bacillota bacterium]|jgi:adenylate kinase family enzyme|nr:AAA family ATPase [Bacillota bacterium]